MNKTFEELLTSVYELEGLLLVMQRHNGDVPQFILDRFSEEAQNVAEMAKTLSFSSEDEADSQSSNEPAAIPEQEKDPVVIAKPEAKPIAMPEPEPVLMPEPEADPVEIANNEHDDEITQFVDPQPTEKEQEEPQVKAEEPERREAETEHKRFHDITSAFSINDRFLFQRELFDGDKQKFDDAIALMQRQPNIDKMKEFMTDILEWDTSDEVVKEFVRLVELSYK